MVKKQSVEGVVTGKPVASRRHARPREGDRPGRSCTASSSGRRSTRFDLEGQRSSWCRASATSARTPRCILATLGVSLVAVGDHTGYLYNPEGFNAHKLQDYVEQNGSIAGYPNGTDDHARGVLRRRGRHLRARARSRTRSAPTRRRRSRCELVAEGANGPCNPEGESVLARARHRHPPGRPRELRRRHRQLLRVGAEQAQRAVDARRGRRAAREARCATRTTAWRSSPVRTTARIASPATASRPSASRRCTSSAKSFPERSARARLSHGLLQWL